MTDLLPTPSGRDSPVPAGERWRCLTELDRNPHNQRVQLGANRDRSLNSSPRHYFALASDRRYWRNHWMLPDTMSPVRT